MKTNTFIKEKILPFSLSAAVFTLDQVSKAFIVRHWPVPGTFIADVFNNGLLYIYHVRNKVIAFSLGQGVPEGLRPVLFVAVPLAVLVFLCVYSAGSAGFTRIQRWAVAGIVGGGAGNLADRVFRPDGVVDFVSVKFFGIFGFERWPTFNVGDSAVVVCVLIWFISVFVQGDGSAPKNAARPARQP